MKKFTVVMIFSVFFSAGFNFTYTQDKPAAESELLSHFKKLPYWAFYYSNFGLDTTVSPSDSLERENTIFQKGLLNYTTKYPETLSGDFSPFVKEGLILASSDDGLFRIYSWDTETGGTMHFYDNLYQFKSGDKIISVSPKRDTIEGGDPGAWFSNIYSLQADKGKKYYMSIGNSEYSTKDMSQKLKFFNIENGTLNDTIALAKTEAGRNNAISNELSVGYDFFKVKDTGERPLKIILVDAAKKTISIPFVTDDGKVTNKYTVYRFTGQYFEPLR